MSTASSFAPLAARTGQPLKLAMQRLRLTGQVLPAGASLTVEHVFQSDEDLPIEVIYTFPLPRDAAFRSFRIAGEGFEMHSEWQETAEAVKLYERGIAQGALAAMTRQYGDGLVSLTVGNLRPKEKVTVRLELLAGVELRDDGLRFRFPFTLAPAYHPRMRTAMSDGEGEMELPANEFGDLILPRFRKDSAGLHQVEFELALPDRVPVEEIGSPSHAIRVRHLAEGGAVVALAPERDVPNRDLVLDVRFGAGQARVMAGPAENGKTSFAIVAPSTLFPAPEHTPRHIAILLDRSGSMQGEPLAQAVRAIEACIASLSEEDSFALLAFSDRVEAMGPGRVRATREERARARAFLQSIGAHGGTNLAHGVAEAAKALSGAGDVVILTDGQVSGTEEILALVRAAGVRLFCLGIGSASQDRFLALLSRETGGVSRFVTPRERVDMAAVDLFACAGRPLAWGLKAEGVKPEPSPMVFAGTPLLLFGERESAGGRVELKWDGGRMGFDVPAGDPATGETVRLLRGSRLITDLESLYTGQEANGPLEKRMRGRNAARLLALCREFGLGCREMSLVAVVTRTGDRAGELPQTRVVTVAMPQDVEMSAYFSTPAFSRVMAAAPPPNTVRASLASFDLQMPRAIVPLDAPHVDEDPVEASFSEESLVGLAGMLEPDGGMPGDDAEERTVRTIAALYAFVEAGHTTAKGAFRRHVQRLAAFLRSISPGPRRGREMIQAALQAAETGKGPKGKWRELAGNRDAEWARLELALEGRFA